MLFSPPQANRMARAQRSRILAQAAQIESLEMRTLMSAWYVSTSGSDSAAGTLAAPLQTIQAAINKAASGDTITVRGGTYGQALTITKPNLTIQSYTGETARIAVSSTNSAIEVAVRIGENADNTKLLNLDISGGYYYALKTESTWDTGASNPHGPKYLLISGSKLHDSGRDVIKLTPATDYSVIENCEIYNSGRRDGSNAEGIDAVQANYATVRDSIIHDTTTNGIYYKGGSVNTVIERNRIYNIAYSGILLGQQSDENWFNTTVNPYYYESIGGIVRDNLVYNTQGAGIGAWAAQNAQIYNNTMVNVAQTMFGGLLIQGQEHWPSAGPLAGQYLVVPSNNVTMYNNIVQMSSSRPVLNIRTGGLTGTLTMSNNLYYNTGSGTVSDDVHSYYGGLSGWQAKGYDAGSLWASPQLDATGSNYKPTSSSPAIDKGKTAPAAYDFGMNGRPSGAAFDIGAWEFGGTPTTTPTPTPTPDPTPAPAPTPTYTPTWTNNAFTTQQGTFTVEWDATPKMANEDTLMGLSNGSASSITSLAAIVRFNEQGTIDARNGSAYAALASVGYSANSKYHVKMVVNVTAHTYDVFVTDAAGRTTQIARSYAFRTEQAGVTQLSNRGMYNCTGDATLTSPTLTTVVVPPTTYTPAWTNSAFTAQKGTFTAEWDATPKMAKQDMIMGLSNGSAGSVTSVAAVVRFNNLGTIDARNGGTYSALAGVSYAAGSKYHIRMVVNVTAHTYDVFITDPTGKTTQIARSYAFRTEQARVTQLSNRATYNFTGDATLTTPVISQVAAATATVKNLAIGGRATASGQESTSTAAAYAIDGSSTSRWASGGWNTMRQPKWIQVDLGATRTITSVNINWEWAAAKGYQIQVSNDGTNWTTAATVTDGAQGQKNTAVSATGRFVRIYCTQAATAYGYSMWDLQIMGY